MTRKELYHNSDVNYKGELEGFPKEVVERMLFWQEKQFGVRDIKVFEKDATAGHPKKGFVWSDTTEGYEFWKKVIRYRNFDRFYVFTGSKVEEITKEPMRCYLDLGGGNKVEFLIDGLDINFDKGFIKIKAK